MFSKNIEKVIALTLINIIFFNLEGFGTSPNWQVDPSDFQHTMTAIVTPHSLCELEYDANDMVALIDENNQVRSVSNFLNLGNKAFMTVYGNTFGDTLRYSLYDASNDAVYQDTESFLIFIPDGEEGTSSNPKVLNFDILKFESIINVNGNTTICRNSQDVFYNLMSNEDVQNAEWSYGTSGVSINPNSNDFSASLDFSESADSGYLKVVVTKTCFSIVDSIFINYIKIQSQTEDIVLNCTDKVDTVLAIQVSHGQADYDIEWKNEEVQIIAENQRVEEGKYFAHITDANGCTHSDSLEITRASDPLSTIDVDFLSGDQNICKNTTNEVYTALVNNQMGNISWEYIGGNVNLTETANQNKASIDFNENSDSSWLKVTATNHCSSISDSIFINYIQIQSNTEDVVLNCTDKVDTLLMIDLSHGESPYIIEWSKGDASISSSSKVEEGIYDAIVTDNNGCQHSDQLEITRMSNPLDTVQVNFLSGKQTICIAEENVPYNLTFNEEIADVTWEYVGGNVVINEENDQSSAQLTFQDNADSSWLKVTAENYCSSITDSIFINYIKIQSKTEDVVLDCTAKVDTLLAIEVFHGEPVYDVGWRNETEDVITDNQRVEDGKYFAHITDANGCTHSDSLEITRASDPLSTIAGDFLSGDQTICKNTTNQVYTALVNNQMGNISWEYIGDNVNLTETANQNKASIDFNENSDSSWLKVTATNHCSSISDSIFINYIQIESNTEDVVLNCTDKVDTLLELKIQGGAEPYILTWENELNQTVQNSERVEEGSYYVGILDDNGCMSFDSLEITRFDNPLLSIPDKFIFGSNEICNNSKGKVYNSLVNSAMGNITWEYVNSEAHITPSVFENSATVDFNEHSDSSWLKVSAANYCGEISDSIFINYLKIRSSTENLVINCTDNTDTLLSIEVIQGKSPYEITWSDADNHLLMAGERVEEGWYYASISDSNGCSHSDSLNISRMEDPLASISPNFITGDTTVCLNTQDETYNAGVNNTMGEISWNYVKGNVGLSESSDQSTITLDFNENSDSSFLKVTASNYCSTISDSIMIGYIQIESETRDVILDCATHIDTILNIELSGSESYDIIWKDTLGQTILNNQRVEEGKYYADIMDNNSCSIVDSLSVSRAIDPLLGMSTSLIQGDSTICFDSKGQIFSASVDNSMGNIAWEYAAGNVLIQESMNEDSVMIDFNSNSDSSYLKVTASNHCSAISDSFPVHYIKIVDLSEDIILDCSSDQDTLLNAIVSGGSFPYNFTWKNDSSQTINANDRVSTGDYTFTVEDQNQCENSGTVSIMYAADPLENEIIDIAGPQNICPGTQNVNFTIESKYLSFGKIKWSSHDNQISLEGDSSNANILTSFDSFSSTSAIKVNVENYCTEKEGVMLLSPAEPLVCEIYADCPMEAHLNETVFNTINHPNVYSSQELITITGDLPSNYAFRSGKEIEFRPGFELDLGNTVTAEIQNCIQD